MRISDWSSDVCSSDLMVRPFTRWSANCTMATSPPRAPGCAAKGATCIDTGSVAESLEQRQKPHRIVPVGFAPRPRRLGFAVGAPAPNRKHLVQGKGVAVRVDTGGRRNLKKKNK